LSMTDFLTTRTRTEVRGLGLGQGLVSQFTSTGCIMRTRTFLEDNNTGLLMYNASKATECSVASGQHAIRILFGVKELFFTDVAYALLLRAIMLKIK